MPFVYREIARDSRRGEFISQFERAHTQRRRADRLTIRFPDPDLPRPGRIIQKVPIILFLKVVEVRQIPAPQIDDDLLILFEMRWNDRVPSHQYSTDSCPACLFTHSFTGPPGVSDTRSIPSFTELPRSV